MSLRRQRPLGRRMVPRGLAAQPAPDPRHQELACPVDVVPPDVEGAAHRQRRPLLLGVGRHVEAEHLSRAERHARVPLGRQVQPVGVPGPAVLDAAQGPQVEHRAAVPVGDGPDMPVVRGDLATQVLEHGHATGVEPGRHHDRAGHGRELGDGALEALGHLVRVGAGPEDVVAARAERDEVRGQCRRPWGAGLATIWSRSFPRTARLVYWKSPSGLRSASRTANRSAQPTNAPSGPGSPTPSVKLSPTATYDPITALLSLFESSATAAHDSPSNVTYATVGRG